MEAQTCYFITVLCLSEAKGMRVFMERYIIKANKIIARDQLEVMENSGLLIENGKIQKIYDNISQVEIQEQKNVIDYGDKGIITGMIE